MSTTLDTMLSLSGWAADRDLASSVEVFARRGRGGSSHFFFFGSGGSGLLAVPIAIIAVLGGYLMRNPDKARALKDRLKNGQGAASPPTYTPAQPPTYPLPAPPVGANLPTPSAPPLMPPPPPPPKTYPTTAVAPPAMVGPKATMRFNAPPGWLVPGPDWTPTAEWRPDASWPPAPTGWQFWAPLQPKIIEKPAHRFSAGTTYS